MDNNQIIRVRSKRRKLYNAIAVVREITRPDGVKQTIAENDRYVFWSVDVDFVGHIFMAKKKE